MKTVHAIALALALISIPFLSSAKAADSTTTLIGRVSLHWNGYKGRKGTLRKNFKVRILQIRPDGKNKTYSTSTDDNGVYVLKDIPNLGKFEIKQIGYKGINKSFSTSSAQITPGKTAKFVFIPEHIYNLDKRGNIISFTWVVLYEQAFTASLNKKTRRYTVKDVDPLPFISSIEVFRQTASLKHLQADLAEEADWLYGQASVSRIKAALSSEKNGKLQATIEQERKDYPSNKFVVEYISDLYQNKLNKPTQARDINLQYAQAAHDPAEKARAYDRAARISSSTGNSQDAVRFLKKALDLAPPKMKPSLAASLARHHIGQNENDPAAEILRKVASSAETAQDLITLARVFSDHLLQPQQALQLVNLHQDKFAARPAEKATLFVYLGKLYSQLDDRDALAGLVEQMKPIKETAAETFLVSHFRNTGQIQEAAAHIESASRRQPETYTLSGFTWFDYLYDVADSKELAGELSKMRYRKAIAAPQNTTQLDYWVYATLLKYLALEKHLDQIDKVGAELLKKNPDDRKLVREILSRLEKGERRNSWLQKYEKQLRAYVKEAPEDDQRWRLLIETIARERSDVPTILSILQEARTTLKNPQFGTEIFAELATQPAFFDGLQKKVNELVDPPKKNIRKNQWSLINSFVQALLSRGEHRQALRQLAALERRNMPHDLRVQLVRLLLRTGDKDKALTHVSRFKTSKLNTAEKFAVALLYSDLAQHEKAKALLRAVVKADPDNLDARFRYATLLEQAFEFGAAHKQYSRCVRDGLALRLPKDHLDDLALIAAKEKRPSQRAYKLAERYIDSGDAVSALRIVDNYLKTAPITADLAYIKGRANEERREFIKAQEYYEKSLSLAKDEKLKEALTGSIGRLKNLIAIQKKILEARLLIGRQKYLDAQTILDTLLKASPSYAEAIYLLGQLHDARDYHDKSEAEKYYRQTLTVSPRHADAKTALNNITQFNYLLKRYKVYPNDLDNAEKLVEKFQELGRASDADRVSKEVFDRNPRNEKAMGLLYDQLVNYSLRHDAQQVALKTAQQLVRVSPSSDNKSNVAFALMKNNKLERAMQLAGTIIQAEPNHHGALNVIASIHYQKGDYQASEDWYLRVLRVQDGSVYRSNYGNLLSSSERIREALVQYRRSLKLDPSNITPKKRILMLLIRTGAYAEAESIANRLAPAAPRSALPRLALAHISLSKGNLGDALDQFKYIANLSERNRSAAGYASTLAFAYLYAGENEKYESEKQRALRLAKERMQRLQNAGIDTDFGVNYYALVLDHGIEAEYPAALDAFKKYHERYSNRVWGGAQLGWAEAHSGDYKSALAHVEEVQRLYPGNAETLYRKAWILYKMGQQDMAAATIREALELFPTHLKSLILKREIGG